MRKKFYSPGYPDETGSNSGGDSPRAVDPVLQELTESLSSQQRAAMNWAGTTLAVKWRYRLRSQHQALRAQHQINYISTEMATTSQLVLITDTCKLPPAERQLPKLAAIYKRMSQWEKEFGGTFFSTLEASTGPKAVSFMRLKAFCAGITLWNEGDTADDTFYFILTGAVDVLINGEVKDINQGRGLGVSTSFGEKALMPEQEGSTDAPSGERTAGIRTKTDVIFATLTRIDYLTVIGQLSSQLSLVLRTRPEDRSGFGLRLLEKHFDVITAAGHAVSFSKRLSRACTYRQLRSNEPLFKQGDEADAFFIIISGYVQVIIDGKAIGCLGPGEAFGEAGLNLEDPEAKPGIRSAGIIGGFQLGLPGAPTFDEIQATMIQDNLGTAGAKNLLTKNRKKNRQKKKKQKNISTTTELAVISRVSFKRLVKGTEHKVKQALASPSKTRSAEEVDLLIDLLRTTPFFDVIASPVVQKRCCRSLQLHEAEPGEYLFKTGDPGDLFFIIVYGTVRGELPNGKTFLLHTGASFGELAVLGNTDEERTRSCAMVCTHRCIFATLARPDYVRLVGSLPDQAMQVLCKRPDKRTPYDLSILHMFFSDSEFFKDLHFPYLQMLVAEHMTLQGLRAPNFLFQQDEDTDGHLYFLLAGRLQAVINGQNAATPYEPVKVFWDSAVDGSPPPPTEEDEADSDSQTASSKQPVPVVDENDANLRCSMSIYAMVPDKREAGAKTAVATGFPHDWVGAELYDVFKQYGDISSIRLLDGEPTKNNYGHMVTPKLAHVTFASGQSVQRAVKDKIMVESATGKKIRLNVQVAEEATSSKKVLKSHEIRFREIRKNEVIVSHLSKKDYDEFVVGALKDLVNVLMTEPRKRSIKSLALVATFFSETQILMSVSRSKMLGRNLCRFIGCQTFAAGTRMYRRGLVGDRVYIVLKGAVTLRKTILASSATGGVAPTLLLRGSELGMEILDDRGEKRYEMVCTAATDVIMAVLLKEDFLRICDMEPMQAAIDQLWQLGIENNQSTEVLTREDEIDDEQNTAVQDTAETQLKFDGYKAVYMRIVKTIAENHLSKKSDQEAALQDDWHNDLELYGDVDADSLSHDQYSNSLYQLVDEWCGGVEHTGMYIKMLEMIVENSTEVNSEGKLVLMPVKKQSSRYQQLMDSRSLYQRYQQQILVKSKIGKPEIGDAPLSAEDAWGDILKASHASHGADDLLRNDNDDEDADHNLAYYRQMFDSMDDDGSGELDKLELSKLCTTMGRDLNPEELDLAMVEMDQDGGGTICFEEFSKWYRRLTEGDALLQEVFQSVDIDGSGSLDREEIQEVLFQLGKFPSETELDAAMNSMDGDGGGDVDFEEFMAWFNVWSAKQDLLERQAAFQRLTRFDANQAQEIFDSIDEDGSGELDQQELAELCQQLGRDMTNEELQLAMQEMDHDGGGTISFDEFAVWFKELTEGDNLLREVFDAVDMDGGGVLDRDEVSEVMIQLGENISSSQLDEIMLQMDEDGSGEVEFEEFAAWFNVWRTKQSMKADPASPDDATFAASEMKRSEAKLSESGEDLGQEITETQEGMIPAEKTRAATATVTATVTEINTAITTEQTAAERKAAKMQNAQLRKQRREQLAAEKTLQKQQETEARLEQERNVRLAQARAERMQKQEDRAKLLAAQQMKKQAEQIIKQCNCSSCQLGEPCAVQRGRNRREAAELVVDPFPEMTKHLEQHPGWKVIFSSTKIQACWRRLMGLHRSVQLRASRHFYNLKAIANENKYRLGIDAKMLFEVMARSSRELTPKECEVAIAWCNNDGYMLFDHFRDWFDWLTKSDSDVCNAFVEELSNFRLDSSNSSEDDADFMLSSKAKASIRATQQQLSELEIEPAKRESREEANRFQGQIRELPVPVEAIPGIAKRLAPECFGAAQNGTHAAMMDTEIKALIDSFTFRPEKMKTLQYVQEWWLSTVLPQFGRMPKPNTTKGKWRSAWRITETLESMHNEALEATAAERLRKAEKKSSAAANKKRGTISQTSPRKASESTHKPRPRRAPASDITEVDQSEKKSSGAANKKRGTISQTSPRKASESTHKPRPRRAPASDIAEVDQSSIPQSSTDRQHRKTGTRDKDRSEQGDLDSDNEVPASDNGGQQMVQKRHDIQPKTPVQFERRHAETAFAESPYQLAGGGSGPGIGGGDVPTADYLAESAAGEIPRLSHNELINQYLTLINPTTDTVAIQSKLKAKRTGAKNSVRAARVRSSGPSPELRPWTGETPFETTAEVVQRHKNSRQRLANTEINVSSTSAMGSGAGLAEVRLSNTYDSMGSYISTPGLSSERGFSANAERQLDPAFEVDPLPQHQQYTIRKTSSHNLIKQKQIAETATVRSPVKGTPAASYALVDESAPPRPIATAAAQARIRASQRAQESNSRLARRTASGSKSVARNVPLLKAAVPNELMDPAAAIAGPRKMAARPLLVSPESHVLPPHQHVPVGLFASSFSKQTQPEMLPSPVGAVAAALSPRAPQTAMELRANALALQESRNARVARKVAGHVLAQTQEAEAQLKTMKRQQKLQQVSAEMDLMLLKQLQHERKMCAQLSSLRTGRATVELPRRQDYKQQPVTWERFNATTSDSLHMRSDDEDDDVQYGVAFNVTSAHLNKSMPNLRQGNRISGSTSLPTIQRSRSGRTGRGGRKSGHSTKKKPPWNKRQHNPSTLLADGSIAPAKAWALAKLRVFTEESGAGTFKPGSMGKSALAKLARYQPVGAVRGPASATRSYAMYRMPV